MPTGHIIACFNHEFLLQKYHKRGVVKNISPPNPKHGIKVKGGWERKGERFAPLPTMAFGMEK